MANPKTNRQGGPVPLGTRNSPGSPNNNLIPLFTPGPIGFDYGALQCVEPSGNMSKVACQYLYLKKKPFLVGVASDVNINPLVPLTVKDPELKNNTLEFGQDARFGAGRASPQGQSVADNESDLKEKMLELLDEFASGDNTGMAKRLFDQFLKKNNTIKVFEDKAMNSAIGKHENYLAFSRLALGASASSSPSKKFRIHQALRYANWDINKVLRITDLGVPAFNIGDKKFSTGDFNNGLGVMINSVQYVLVYVEDYFYHCFQNTYDITLKFVIYDVFGLDDDDLNEFGASSSWNMFDAKQGITAWWQLQHQFSYAPLLTRAEVTRTFNRVLAI
jgi:hypothetical protein